MDAFLKEKSQNKEVQPTEPVKHEYPYGYFTNSAGQQIIDTPRMREREKYFEDNPRLNADERQKIVEGRVFMRMTEEQAYFAWGSPNRKNTSTFATGTFSQWVYDRAYLYFRDGILESWDISE
jgi:hypothetical protein